MRLLWIDGIPHWVENGLALPVMAGAQGGGDTADYTQLLEQLQNLQGGGPTKSGAGLRFPGDADNIYTLQLIRDREPQPYDFTNGRAGPGVIDYGAYQTAHQKWTAAAPKPYFVDSRDPTGQTRIAFQPGEYTDALGRTYSLDAKANILGQRVISTAQQLGHPYSSTEAAQREAEAAAAAEHQRQREFDAEQNRLAAEARLREARLSAARSLAETQIGERSQARQQSVQLAGEDAFRFLAQIHQATVGDLRTPYDVFKGTLANISTQQTPNIGSDASLADLESAITKMQQTHAENQQALGGSPALGAGPAGFAGGGTMMNGTPHPGGTGKGVLVGEAGPEVVEVTPNGIRVIPIVRSAQTGMDTANDYNLTVLPQLFENLRRGITGGTTGAQAQSRLGFVPSGTASNPTFGQGYGGMATPLSLAPGYNDMVRAGIIAKPDADRITAAIGELPNPRNAAALLRNLTPTETQAVLSAYRLAGIPDADFKALVESAQIAGPQRQLVSYAA